MKNKIALTVLSMTFVSPVQCGQDFNLTGLFAQSIGPIIVSSKLTQTVSGKVIAAVVGALVVGKIAYDVSWHGEYAERVKKYHKALQSTVDLNEVRTVEYAALKAFATKAMKQEALFLEQSLYNSYGSWVCPWNWTAQQKNLFQQAQVVSVLTLYADLVALGDAATGADVAKTMRQLYVQINLYPCVYGHSQLQRQIAFARSYQCADRAFAGLLCDIADRLDQFANLLIEQNDYVQELQVMKTHQQQQQINNNLTHIASRDR